MTVDQALDAAEQLTNAGRSVEAERLLLHVLAVQPNHALALHMLAAIAGQSGRMDRALALLSRAAAQTPHDPELLYHLGLASHMSGKYPEAIAAYDAAIALRPEFAEAHSNRAITNLLLGNFEKGLPEYEWRRKSRFANLPSLPPGPVWDGHPPEGKTILLIAEL
jgi:Flp pilus assembly protein TadD